MTHATSKTRPAIDEGTIILRRIVPARVVVLGQYRRNAKGRHGRLDRAQLDALMRGRWDQPFALASIPIDALNFQDVPDSDPDRIARAERYARMDTPLPPAFVTYRGGRRGGGRGYVADGNHRVLAAALRGNQRALVYIPVDDLRRLLADSERVGLTTGMVDLSKPRRSVAVRNPARRVRNPESSSVGAALNRLAALPQSSRSDAEDGDVDLPIQYDARASFPPGKRADGGWEPYFAGTHRIRLDDLRAWQRTVGADTVAGYIRRGPRTVVVVVQRDGRAIVADGHHRLMAAYLLGETSVDARVYDLRVPVPTRNPSRPARRKPARRPRKRTRP